MAQDEIEKGRRYFCREETTGNGRCGMFIVDDDDMAAELFAFDERYVGKFDDLLVLRLETNDFASLHNNITNGPAGHYNTVTSLHTSSIRVISNAVVVGETPWQPNDAVRRVEFSIKHADDLLHHTAKFDAIADAEFGKIPETTLFAMTVGGMTVKAWYSVSGNLTFKRPTKIDVRYGIEFDEPRELTSYMPDMLRVVHFVSAVLGFRLAPSGIRISRLTNAGYLAAVEARKGYRGHDVHYLWPGDTPKRSLSVARAVAHVRDDEEMAYFIECMRAWIDRDADWRGATNMMMGALGLQNTISGERLMTACGWLEEIPGAGSEMAVSDADIDAIAAIAAEEADKRGHKDYKARIAGVIRGQLKKESNAERFARLHKKVHAQFGEEALGDDVIPHLLQAMQFRGRVAHGHFEPESDEDFQAFSKAIYAMEALCYLLTIKDLPMSGEGARRIARQTIVTNFRLSH